VSEPRFTPGPWDALPKAHYVHVAGKGHVAKITNPWNDGAEREANVRLIAAAPELYDGCNALLGLVQLILGRDDLSDELREVLTTNHRIAEASAATAKARGDQ
jgi:hypothetical protein